MREDKQAAPVARRTHKRGQMKKAHNISVEKSLGIIKLESRLETSAAIALSLDPRVKRFRPQPMTIEMITGRIFRSKEELERSFVGLQSKPHPYTPDFEVTLEDGSLLLEAKHSRLIEKSPEILDYPSILKGFGLRLVVINETFFPEVFCQNIRLLHPYQSHCLSGAETRNIIAASATAGTIGDLIAKHGIPQKLILAAIANGILHAELHDCRLGYATKVLAHPSGCSSHMRLPL